MNVRSILAAIGLVFLAGCSGPGPSGNPQSRSDLANSGSDFKVALLTPGAVSDAGWNALGYEGLQAIHKQLGASIAQQQATGPQIKDAMRTYAQQGYSLVIGHGFEYNAVGVEVAKDFPKTVFVSSSGSETAPNAGAIRFYLEQGCYLAGMVAAKVSKSGIIGSVAVQNYPSIVSTIKAYEAGAKAARPDIKIVPTAYFGTEGDIAKAKQATDSVLAQGADVIIHQANAAAQGVFDACKSKGAYAIGTNANQNSNPSGIVIGSAVIVATPAFVDLAKQVKDGSYKGTVTLYGMDKGAIDFIFNPAYLSKIPKAVQTLVSDTEAKIKSGRLVVPKINF